VYWFLFWFIFYRLCRDHYHASSMIFFSPFVHSLAVCASHNDSSMGCYTWLGFFIFSTHHN
jgi:hypothetical protein